MALQRLVLDFRNAGLVVRCLYRSRGDSNPDTKARRREVLDLTREGLSAALEAFELGGARARVRAREGRGRSPQIARPSKVYTSV